MAQSAQATTNILFRVLMVRRQIDARSYEQGSMFSIDVDGRQYWITAKHILTGEEHAPFGVLKMKAVSLEILDPQSSQVRWLTESFSVIDAGLGIDIVALAPARQIFESPLASPPPTSEGAPIGGECEFLGFPYGNTWTAKFAPLQESFRMPFIKHCVVSGLVPEPHKIWFLDGINNKGFSGGPVVFNTGTNQKIMGVVSSYVYEPVDVVSVGKSQSAPTPVTGTGEVVDVNAGFIMAFDISYVMDAIKNNPIGPLISNKK